MNMKFIFQSSLFAFLICLLSSCEPQKDLNLIFEVNTLSEIVNKELLLGAKVDTLQKDISKAFKPTSLEGVEASTLIRAIREDASLPLITRYYFTESGQLIFTHYEWSKSVPGITYEERERVMATEGNEFNKYANKLEEVAQYLRNEMGDPVENDGALKKNDTSLLDFFSYKLKFKKEQKVVELRLVWSPKRGARFFKVLTKTYWEN